MSLQLNEDEHDFIGKIFFKENTNERRTTKRDYNIDCICEPKDREIQMKNEIGY